MLDIVYPKVIFIIYNTPCLQARAFILDFIFHRMSHVDIIILIRSLSGGLNENKVQILHVVTINVHLSYDITSESVMKPCIKNDNQLVD